MTALAFSPDGTMLAVVAADGGASLWSIPSGREVGAVQIPAGPLQSVAFSGDGRVLAMGGFDGSVSLWDVAKIVNGEPQGS